MSKTNKQKTTTCSSYQQIPHVRAVVVREHVHDKDWRFVCRHTVRAELLRLQLLVSGVHQHARRQMPRGDFDRLKDVAGRLLPQAAAERSCNICPLVAADQSLRIGAKRARVRRGRIRQQRPLCCGEPRNVLQEQRHVLLQLNLRFVQLAVPLFLQIRPRANFNSLLHSVEQFCQRDRRCRDANHREFAVRIASQRHSRSVRHSLTSFERRFVR